MGATTFGTRVPSDNSTPKGAEDAYRYAVDQAHYEYGHDPYNGTISTTNGFWIVPDRDLPDFRDPGFSTADWHAFDNKLEDDPRTEKWERCAAYYADGFWHFVGWAAS